MIVKLWNDNDYDYKTKFKGDDVLIKAHSFKEMDLFEANDLKGQYFPIAMGGNGLQDPKTMSMLRIERPSVESEDDMGPELHACMSCKKKYESAPVLEAHIKTAHADAETLALPDVDVTLKKKKKAG